MNLMNGSGMLDNVAVVHVDAPGHEDGSISIEDPAPISLEMLAQQLNTIVVDVGVEKFIGLGVGAGSNVLLRYASIHPSKGTAVCVIAVLSCLQNLCLILCDSHGINFG